MAQKVSPITAITKALPAVQAALRKEIAARIAAGEDIARIEGKAIISNHPPTRDLRVRRKELLEGQTTVRKERIRVASKSIA